LPITAATAEVTAEAAAGLIRATATIAEAAAGSIRATATIAEAAAGLIRATATIAEAAAGLIRATATIASLKARVARMRTVTGVRANPRAAFRLLEAVAAMTAEAGTTIAEEATATDSTTAAGTNAVGTLRARPPLSAIGAPYVTARVPLLALATIATGTVAERRIAVPVPGRAPTPPATDGGRAISLLGKTPRAAVPETATRAMTSTAAAAEDVVWC
jgi:hypothetical protein